MHPIFIRRCRGVSLVEALVALAAMAIGMLGIVGMQATLRGNSDLAKQRSEAVRVAQEAVEEWRAVTALADTEGQTDYADIATVADEDIAGVNATFTVTRTVVPMDAREDIPDIDTVPRAKSLRVAVNWTDRVGEPQSVSLSTAIAGVMPELAATLAVPPDGDPVRQPSGRNRGVPHWAKTLAPGISGGKPPGAPADVAWRFDDVSGLITLCTTSAASTDALTLENVCDLSSGGNALLLSGFVRYALTDSQPTEADAQSPVSDALNSMTVSVARTDGGLAAICYSQTVAAASKYTVYNCAVSVTVTEAVPKPTWRGTVSMALTPADLMAATLAENSASKFKVCSYPHIGTFAGAATFAGGGNAMVLTLPFGRGQFRSWTAGSRIDLAYGNKAFAHSVTAAVAVPAGTSQTVPVNPALPGAGAGLSGAAYAPYNHPGGVASSLVNQNYLVIRAGNAPAVDAAFTCPTSTLKHQPAS